MLVCMGSTRTTITIDEDLLDQVKREAAENHSTVSELVQESLRERFMRREQHIAPFTLRPVDTGGYQPGVDIASNAAVRDLLDSE